MPSNQATITYLFHSGFAVETAQCFLIFDYYQPSSPQQKSIAEGFILLEMLQAKQNIYVFASHNHFDHFDPTILNWASHPSLTYILSNDIRIKKVPPHCQFLAPYQSFKDDRVSIQTFGSTDQGVSFEVQVDGLTLFHAGDLNWWHWKEDTPEDQAQAASAFKSEIAKITGHAIDIAFFPVDRRLEEFFAEGALYFAKELHPRLLIPMHFATDFATTQIFAAKVQGLPVQTVAITHQGQQIVYVK